MTFLFCAKKCFFILVLIYESTEPNHHSYGLLRRHDEEMLALVDSSEVSANVRH